MKAEMYTKDDQFVAVLSVPKIRITNLTNLFSTFDPSKHYIILKDEEIIHKNSNCR